MVDKPRHALIAFLEAPELVIHLDFEILGVDLHSWLHRSEAFGFIHHRVVAVACEACVSQLHPHVVVVPCLPVALNQLEVALHSNDLADASISVERSRHQVALQWNQSVIDWNLLFGLIEFDLCRLVISDQAAVMGSIVETKQRADGLPNRPKSLVAVVFLRVLCFNCSIRWNVDAYQKFKDQNAKSVDVLL